MDKDARFADEVGIPVGDDEVVGLSVIGRFVAADCDDSVLRGDRRSVVNISRVRPSARWRPEWVRHRAQNEIVSQFDFSEFLGGEQRPSEYWLVSGFAGRDIARQNEFANANVV